MVKRKRKGQRTSRPAVRSRKPHQRSPTLRDALERANALIERGRAQEAIDLLEPMLLSHPRVADLHFFMGYASATTGDLWGALAGYERAMSLSRDPSYWQPLASIYLNVEMNAHALQALRHVLKREQNGEAVDDARRTIAELEQEIAQLAQALQIPIPQAEQGLRHLENGIHALQQGNYQACITANRQAIKLLSNWPPPRNNLSLALFFAGQPNEALAVARRVLSQAPDNLQALSNAIRFLTWTGQEEEARDLWSRLKAIEPQDVGDCLKMTEAAASLHEDEYVLRLLGPLDQGEMDGTPRHRQQAQLFLAVAEANLGKPAARKRLKALQGSVPRAGDLLQALESGRRGPGWADRFPYFHSSELVPRVRIEEFIELMRRKSHLSPERFQSQMARFVARVPQIVSMAEKLIWEENQLEVGVGILEAVNTPAAVAALRRFGLSQIGDDDTRMQALYSLLEAGEIEPGETLRVWARGNWREVQLRRYDISDEPKSEYSPAVADLMNEGVQAFQRDDHARAELLFRRALDLDSGVKEAYNNLGAIYARQGDHAQAREMFQAALEIDPLYVIPRCNQAIYLLGDGDTDEALAMLAPLSNVTRFHPQEMAFYSYTQARVLMHQEEYEAARNALEAALEVVPGYDVARELLGRLEMISTFKTGFGSYFERQRKRDSARRARLQAKLSTLEPSLAEALPLYSKEVLTAIARLVLPHGGWSGLRKAELLEGLIGGFRNPHVVDRLVAQLSDEERTALHQVLAGGGHMPWQDFDERYGNDLEESQYWQYREPTTTMGRLRLRGLLVEATVNDTLLVVVPLDVRQMVRKSLRDR